MGYRVQNVKKNLSHLVFNFVYPLNCMQNFYHSRVFPWLIWEPVIYRYCVSQGRHLDWLKVSGKQNIVLTWCKWILFENYTRRGISEGIGIYRKRDVCNTLVHVTKMEPYRTQNHELTQRKYEKMEDKSKTTWCCT